MLVDTFVRRALRVEDSVGSVCHTAQRHMFRWLWCVDRVLGAFQRSNALRLELGTDRTFHRNGA
jgi:hypothetical protein